MFASRQKIFTNVRIIPLCDEKKRQVIRQLEIISAKIDELKIPTSFFWQCELLTLRSQIEFDRVSLSDICNKLKTLENQLPNIPDRNRTTQGFFNSAQCDCANFEKIDIFDVKRDCVDAIKQAIVVVENVYAIKQFVCGVN